MVKDAGRSVCVSFEDASVGALCWLSSKDGVDSELQLGGQGWQDKVCSRACVWKLTPG